MQQTEWLCYTYRHAREGHGFPPLEELTVSEVLVGHKLQPVYTLRAPMPVNLANKNKSFAQ